MSVNSKSPSLFKQGMLLAAGALLWGLHAGDLSAANIDVTMQGGHDATGQSNTGTGTGIIVVDQDGWVSGSVTTVGMAGAIGQIREEGRGTRRGGPIISLLKNGNTYTVPPSTRLDQSQSVSLMLGNLYVNVDTAANPAETIRGQMVMPLFH